jgi:aspartyl-tRNA synthetase
MAQQTTIAQNQYRTHTCGELTDKNVDSEVRLSGWVHSWRDHGGLIFIDLRDRWGLTQLTINPEKSPEAFKAATTLRSEFVVQVAGTVVARPAAMVNDTIATGAIEIEVQALGILSAAKTPPFEIVNDEVANEELRLKYRYLDLRRSRMQHNIAVRHQLLQHIRRFFYERDFMEIETPILIKGTPEGAREYVVPSRLYPGSFYVLPQSPQQLKQLSMVAGFDRYMQIARCFRDEDQRGDRQPEFTQVDIEMSFAEPDDVMALTEECLLELVAAVRPDAKIQTTPFVRLTWEQALRQYGSDKPDLRYGLEFVEVTEECRGSGFKIFADTVEKGGLVQALRVPGGGAFSRRDIDELTKVATIAGGRGLAWIKVTEEGHEGVPVAKLGDDAVGAIIAKTGAKAGDILFFTAGEFRVACESLGAVRAEVAKRLQMASPHRFAFAWVTDFPMFEKDAETGALVAMHHPFTRPKAGEESKVSEDPLSAHAAAYDCVLNGYEIAGGSIRIHEADLQQRIFAALGLSASDIEKRFGHMITAFGYGAPPHGGIAWGFDRLCMLMVGEGNIREVIPYPKDQKARDLMLQAPSEVTPQQLKELHLTVTQE